MKQIISILLIIQATAFGAQFFYLKDGKVVEGDFLRMINQEITISTSAGPLTFPSSEFSQGSAAQIFNRTGKPLTSPFAGKVRVTVSKNSELKRDDPSLRGKLNVAFGTQTATTFTFFVSNLGPSAIPRCNIRLEVLLTSNSRGSITDVQHRAVHVLEPSKPQTVVCMPVITEDRVTQIDISNSAAIQKLQARKSETRIKSWRIVILDENYFPIGEVRS